MVTIHAVESSPNCGSTLEQEPAAARARVVAAELLVKLLVAVDDPAAPLDVGLAQDTPCAAWTSPRKQGVSSSKSGGMAHLLGYGLARRTDSPTWDEEAAGISSPRETARGPKRFAFIGECVSRSSPINDSGHGAIIRTR